MTDQKPAEADSVVAAAPTAPPPLYPGDIRAEAMPQQPWAADVTADGLPKAYTYHMEVAPGRVVGQASDYRSGTAALTPEGVTLDGKAVLPSSTRTVIVVVCLFLLRLGAVLVSLLLEYAIRVQRHDVVPWECVQEIVIERPKRRVCIVHTLPGKPKPIYSLAFKPRYHLDHFEQAARYFLPDRVREGTIGPVTPVWVYIVFVGLLAAIFFGILYATTHH